MTDYWDMKTGEKLSRDELYRRFDEAVDEAYGRVVLADAFGFAHSWVYKQVAPSLYEDDFELWLDGESGESITDDPTDPAIGASND